MVFEQARHRIEDCLGVRTEVRVQERPGRQQLVGLLDALCAAATPAKLAAKAQHDACGDDALVGEAFMERIEPRA